MNSEKNLNLLSEQIVRIDELLIKKDCDALRQWREETLMVLDLLFGDESKYYENFENIGFRSNVINMRNSALNKQRDEEAFESGLKKAKASLQAIIFGIEKGIL